MNLPSPRAECVVDHTGYEICSEFWAKVISGLKECGDVYICTALQGDVLKNQNFYFKVVECCVTCVKRRKSNTVAWPSKA